MRFTDPQLDEMEARILMVQSVSPEDKVQIDKLWAERRQLIEELRRMYALMQQVVLISYAAFHEV